MSDEDESPFTAVKVGVKKVEIGSKRKENVSLKRKKITSSKKKNTEDSELKKYEKYYEDGDYMNYPLFCTTTWGTNIKKVIEIISPLTPDAILRFTKSGLSILGMEQVKMALLSAQFDSEMFQPFRCERDFDIAIDPQHLSRVLQHVGK